MAFVLGLIAFIYPVMRIIRYVSDNRGNGKKWIALPAVAVSIPLLFSTCTGLMGGTKKTEETTASHVSVVASEEKQLEPSEESSSATEASTTVPTESTTEVTTEETSEVLSDSTETTTTSKETTAETSATISTTTTEERAEETEVSDETPAVTETEVETETETETEAPPVVVDEPDSTTARETIEVKSEERDYILNTSKMKFHVPSCSSVKQMSEKNKEERHCSREELINEGYGPCGNCHP